MGDEAPNAASPRRRSRSQRSKLRRETYLDQVRIEAPFVLHPPRDANRGDRASDPAGDGCYVTATVNNRRFYGVLIDQEALKAASLLHFQEEASGLDLNRRMMALFQQHEGEAGAEPEGNGVGNARKRPASEAIMDVSANGIVDSTQKRHRSDACDPDLVSSAAEDALRPPGFPWAPHQIQKFRFVQGDGQNSEYRELLATFAHAAAAADDDPTLMKAIEAACNAGGDYINNYYYQYEPTSLALESRQSQARFHNPDVMRMSMGFQTFLRKTTLPDWFPLANLETGQQQVLNILNLKKDNRGNLKWDDKNGEKSSIGDIHGIVIPMQPRTRYRVCVVGGGIAGLSSCLEIFRRCEREQIGVEVVLVEGRSRLGGRLWTDRETFKLNDGRTPFPVDLGASWIHGIELNPLAALAREAGVDFVTTSEDVKMLKGGLEELDPDKDRLAGELFDKLLDVAADGSWGEQEIFDDSFSQYSQSAVRWYASVLKNQNTSGPSAPELVDVGDHRRSTDLSVDRAVGNVIANQLLEDFQNLTGDERRMLLWNLKNVEYALGANMSDLSMKFWDIDERHAFDGDHVILRQGYSVIVEHLLKELQLRGPHFQYHVDYAVDKIEYNRKTTSQKYASASRNHQYVDLSDACCVTSRSRSKICCDMVVCCVPLGVLKEAIREEATDQDETCNKIVFQPPLPFIKKDAIKAVGFGLLDKVYMQFPTAFWRTGACGLDQGQTLFGNASGFHPHHYMFFDIGKSLGDPGDEPAILMSLISGREAVKCELMSEAELVEEALEVLRTIFSDLEVPEPIAMKTTRWGSDPFSRGSYTFLPPGATDQDFRALQSPVNGNGDSILLEGSETMRLFFAGEHTTAMHPSMAHGALLSGVRAGEEVVSALGLSFSTDDAFDKLIPMAVFRHMNPKAPLECSLCHLVGGRTYEGPLLAFKRGSRQVLVHNCCAEFSPEVEVEEGQWRYVIKAVNRAVSMECCICRSAGASIGCNFDNCFRCFHFKCAEGTRWKFEEDGKEFYCDLHRSDEVTPTWKGSKTDRSETNLQHALFATSQPKGSGRSRNPADPSNNEPHISSKHGDVTGADRSEDAETDEEEIRTGKLTRGNGGDRDAPTAHAPSCASRLVRLQRPSVEGCWNVELQVQPVDDTSSELWLESAPPDGPSLGESALYGKVTAVNGCEIGSHELDSLRKVVKRLSQEVDVFLQLECDPGEQD